MLMIFPLTFYALGAVFFLLASAYMVYSVIRVHRALDRGANLSAFPTWMLIAAWIFGLVLLHFLGGE